MNWDWTDFFIKNNGMYSIIIGIVLLIALIILRVYFIKRIKDNVTAKQASELRDKEIILRDQYELKIYKQMVNTSSTIIIGVHGLQGQKDDFKLLSSFCKKAEISLISYDRRGVGKNLQDWKFSSIGVDINDLKDVIKAVKSKYPNQKIILFGEAIGAALAGIVGKNNPAVDAVIISNLITKQNLHQFSITFFIKFIFAFIFNSKIQMPVYIDPNDISNSNPYINNINIRYSSRQIWTLRFYMQFKKVNRQSMIAIRNLKQPVLILQSADDVFSDFHQLKINQKYWKENHKYVFSFEGKHALINEPNIREIFDQEIIPWVINKNLLVKKGTPKNETNT